jgi:hypothetical protein
MTKAERIRLIRTYFEEIDRIEGHIPCIQWRHTEQRDIYLYSREDESLSSHEIVVVKSPNSKVDKVLKYAVKHYFQTEEELSVILRSFSAKTVAAPKPAYEKKIPEKAVPEQSYQPKQQPVTVGENVGNDFRPHISKPPVVNQAQNFTNGSEPHIPNQFTRPIPKNIQPPVKKMSVKQVGLKAGLALVVVILLLAVFTNPTVEKHRRAVRENALPALQQTYPTISLASQTSANEAIENTANVESAILGMVHSSDFLFFSLTELRLPEYEKIIGIGIFGQVILKDFDDGAFPSGAATSAEVAQSDKEDSPVNEASQQEMKRAVIVAVMEKFFADPNAKDELTYKFVFHNRSNRNVKSFSGEVVFSDNSGEVLEVLPLTYDRPLGIGERAIFHLTQDYQSSSETVASTDLSEMTIDWEPQELNFNDGTALSM